MERMVRAFVIVALVYILANVFAPAVKSWMERHGLFVSQSTSTEDIGSAGH
jgi:hypothetical protein